MASRLLGAISAGVLASALVHGAWAQSGSDQAQGGHGDMPGHMGASGMSGGHGGGKAPSGGASMGGHRGMHHGMMPQGMHGGSPHGARMMGGGHKMAHGQGMMGAIGKLTSPYIAGVLGFSEEQTQQVEDIQRENAREHWSLTQDLRERHRAMMELMREPAPDPQAVAEAHDQASAAHRQLLVLQAELRGEVLDVLNDEQRQRLQEMHSGSMHDR